MAFGGGNNFADNYGGFPEATPEERAAWDEQERKRQEAAAYTNSPGANANDPRYRGQGNGGAAGGGSPLDAYPNSQDSSLGDALKTSMRGNQNRYEPNAIGYQYGGQFGGAQQAADRYQGIAGFSQNRAAPQMNDQSQRAARSYQNYAAGDYVNTLTGKNPSFANQQMQRGLGQAQANNFSIARSGGGSGINQASAMRAALRGNQSMANSTNQEAGLQAIREREAARQGLASVGGQMRGQDIGWENDLARNQLAQRGMNDQRELGFERMGADVNSQQLQANQNLERSRQEAEQKQREEQYNVEKYNKDQSVSGIGAIGSMITGLFSGSDEGMKKDIAPASVPVNREAAAVEDEEKQKKQKRLDEFQKSFESTFATSGDKSSQQANQSLVAAGGGLGKAFGKAMASSDENCKKGMAGGKLADYARSLKPKTFLYKDEPAGTPKRLGVMAQDMEESEIGESTVSDTPMGKMVHMPRAVSAALASVGEMRKELDALKKTMRKGKKKKKSDDDEDD